MDARAEESRMS